MFLGLEYSIKYSMSREYLEDYIPILMRKFVLDTDSVRRMKSQSNISKNTCSKFKELMQSNCLNIFCKSANQVET